MICSALGTVLLVGLVLVCLPITATRLFGYDAYSVVSGSMEPAIPTGSMVFSKETSFDKLKEGDVITFMISDEQTVTHRIKRINTDKEKFTTKGDANDVEDEDAVEEAAEHPAIDAANTADNTVANNFFM